MHIYNVESPLTRFARGCMCKGGASVPPIPPPPPPPKPPAQNQAASNVDQNMQIQRKKQGYASTILSSGVSFGTSQQGKSILGG